KAGTLMALGDAAGTTVIHELPSGRIVNTIEYSAEWPVYSQDSSGKPVSQAADPKQRAVTALAFSDDGSQIVVGTQVGAVLVWPALQRISKPYRIDTLKTINTVAFHPNGRIVAVGTDDHVSILASGYAAGPIQEHLDATQPVRSVLF